MFKKKEKELEPEFFTSVTGIPTVNYKVYYMKPKEKLMYFLLAFAVGAAVALLFYGGIGKDEFGQPTRITYILNTLIPAIVGFLAARFFIPQRTESIINKRRTELSHQFRDMLDSLTTSLGAGKNVTDSFYSVYDDLRVQYDPEAYILKELETIISGVENNYAIEDLLEDFGNRSDIDDIRSFANVFKVSYRKGGNIKDIIRNTHSILSDKMEISEDIETLVASNKLEQNIMLVMPVVLIGAIKLMSPEFAANFVSPSGLASTTISIAIFAAAYYLGKEILDIKI